MATNERTVGVLNDLIEINNDRVAGFEKAIADINDENLDLKSLFQEYSTQSRGFSQELSTEVASFREDAETGTSMAGNLHRAWIDVKSLFGGSDRKSILEEAERGEDAIKKAYSDAVRTDELSGNTMQVVARQAGEINRAHDRIKALRDSQPD